MLLLSLEDTAQKIDQKRCGMYTKMYEIIWTVRKVWRYINNNYEMSSTIYYNIYVSNTELAQMYPFKSYLENKQILLD